MSVRWKMRVWTRNDRVYRHWVDVELALEWARRYLRARSSGDVLMAADCHRRWWETANLGAYAMRAIGIDPLSAPLARFTAEGPAGRRGLPGAPLEFGVALSGAPAIQAAPKTAGPSFLARSLWAPRISKPAYRFGAVRAADAAPGSSVPGMGAMVSSLASMVFSSQNLDTGAFEHRLHETIRALELEGPSTTFVRDTKAVGTFPSWKTWDIRQVPGLTLAVRWHPVLLDGWWEVVWLDSNERRLRQAAAIATVARCEPEYYDFPDGRAPFFGAPAVAQERAISVPLSEIPDAWIRDEEVAAFARDPWAFLESYTDAIIERNREALMRIDRALASRAELVSYSREAAAIASQVAVDTMVRAGRQENEAAMREVSETANVVPVLGSIAALMVQGASALLSAFGAYDMPEAQKAAVLRDTIAPLSISGTVAESSPRAPTHPVFMPSGWTRGAEETGPGAVLANAVSAATSRPFDASLPPPLPGAPAEGELMVITVASGEYIPPRPHQDLFDLVMIERAEESREVQQSQSRDEGAGIAVPVVVVTALGIAAYFGAKRWA